MHTLTEEQIVQLAPDAASLKAGKELTNATQWLSYAYNTRVMWGEIKGSGSTPYRTQIDLQQTAFKCSCPSRKFPCKHGLALFLLSVRNPNLLAQSAQEPAWVKEWVDKRVEKGTKPPDAAADPPEPQKVDKQAKDREKRQNERLQKVQSGVAELELWLKDLVRTGLLNAPEKGQSFWEKAAARMVDAQAPGLGNKVRELGRINYFSSNEWQETVLQHVASLHLLLVAFKNIDSLPLLLQEDIRSLIGWNQSGKELLENPEAETLRDTWLVLGRQTEVQDDLTIQRNWLYGGQSERYALILNFAYKNTPIPVLLTPATAVEAELAFYASNYPLRAVVKQQGTHGKPVVQPKLLEHWEAAQEAYAQVLSQQPWADTIPLAVAQLTPVREGSRWLLRDQQEGCLPLAAGLTEQKVLQLLAYSGGQPLDLFLLRTQPAVLPVGLWYEGLYRTL